MGNPAHDIFGKPILVTVRCATCTVPFGLHQPTYDRRKDDQSVFYCPHGHQNFYQDSEKDLLKKQLAQKEQQLTWAKEREEILRREARHQEGRARAFKGHLTKTRIRVGNGVCPCCNRTFQNLMKHMNTKHPKWRKKND